MWLALLLLFVVAALVLVAKPLFAERESWEVPGKQDELDRLLAAKARALRTLKDLESEFRAELMDRESYDAARQEYIDEAVGLNREIASLTGTDPSRIQEAGVTS